MPFLYKMTDYSLLSGNSLGLASGNKFEVATASSAFALFVGNNIAFLADTHALQVDLLDILVAFALGCIAFLKRAFTLLRQSSLRSQRLCFGGVGKALWLPASPRLCRTSDTGRILRRRSGY